jgi:hypothetical protein
MWKQENVICGADSANILNSPKLAVIVKDNTLVKSEKAINL